MPISTNPLRGQVPGNDLSTQHKKIETKMNYNELSKKAHDNAVEHGFWAQPLSDEHCLMLVVTEVAELVEAHRQGKTAGITAKLLVQQDIDRGGSFPVVFETRVKNTLEDEFADIAIRLFDLAGRLGIDFEQMNPNRYYRAYDHFTFTENAFALCKGISKENIAIVKRVQFGIEYVRKWAKSMDIDIAWHIGAKMEYNRTRPMKHGKKY